MEIVVNKKILVAAIVLTLGVTTVFAGPPAPGRGPAPGDFRPQGGSFEGNGRPPPQHDQEANQRRGKLSADERRELRRQIDEAGQDIYRVKR